MANNTGPEYDGHRLTRRGMEQVLAEGGSVLWNGRLIQHAEHLPNEASLAKGNPEREAVARAALEKQIADLTAQLSQVGANPAPSQNLTHGETGHPQGYEHENTVYGEPAGDLVGQADQERKAELQAVNTPAQTPQPLDETSLPDEPEATGSKSKKAS